MNFDQAFAELGKHEGGYSNHPADPGGETMFGITRQLALAYGYTGEMKSIPVGIRKHILKDAFWDPIHADELPESIRYVMFDAAVNSGAGQAARWLQRALDVADDGRIGPVTILAAQQADPGQLLRELLSLRLQFMTKLSTWDSFGRGWSRRIANLLIST